MPGLLACALAIAIPFFPDEKLVRLKMLAFELGVLMLLAVSGARFFLTERWNNISRGTKILASAVAFWMMVQGILYFLSNEPSLAQAELRRVLLAGGVFLAFAFAGLSDSWKNRFLATWSFSGGLIALYGILQHAGGLGRVAVPQMDRVMGSFGNPIFFAAYLVPTIFLSLSAWSLYKNSLIRLGLSAAMLTQLAALYFTKTRAAWLALAAGLLVWALVNFPSTKARLTLVGLFLVGGGLFAFKTQAIWERDQGHLLIWRDTLRMAADHPLTGVGLGAFHTNFPSYAQPDLISKWPKGQFIVNYSHNEYIQQVAEGGILGLFSFLSVIFVFGWGVLNKWRPANDLFIPLAAFTLLVQNFFSVDMRFGITFGILFLLMGLWAGGDSSPSQRGRAHEGLKWICASAWVVLLAMLVPGVLKPYRAQKIVSSTPGFFDERLLDPLKTIQDLEQAALQYPDQPAVLEKLAFAYAKEIKSMDGKINLVLADKAARAYEKLVELDPGRPSAYNNLANIHFTVGRSDAAIAAWKKAVEIQPNFLDARLNLGKVLYLKGELKESAAQFEKVLEIDPKNAEAIVYLKRMVE